MMIAAGCIIAVAILVAALVVSNTMENLTREFFTRWDALDADE